MSIYGEITTHASSGTIFEARSKRQERFKRPAKPAPLNLSASHRYFQILYWLLRLRFLETRQLFRLLYTPGSLKYAERQLRALYDNGYLDRFPVPIVRRWGRTRSQFGAVRTIHCLSEKGAQYLAEQLQVERSGIPWRKRHNHQPGNLDHTLAVNDFLITAQLGAERQGWTFELLQTEREIQQPGGHDLVRDPVTGSMVTVMPDSVCRLVLTPLQKGIYFSPEIDRGTEGVEKIKAKVRAHTAHFESSLYTRRHATQSNRILFIVADVRDPIHGQPLTEAEWREKIRKRCAQLLQWTQASISEEHRELFWYVPAFELTPENIYTAAVWQQGNDPSLRALL